MRVFHAGLNYYRLRLATWSLAQVFALAGLLFWTAILVEVEEQVHARQDSERPSSGEGVPDTAREAAPASPDTGSPPRNWIERAARQIESAAKHVTEKEPDDRSRGLRGWIEGYVQFFVELALLLPGWVFPLIWVIKLGSYVLYFVQLPVTYAVRRLDYEMRWYLVTDRSLRLRQGVWHVTESTMSFANIQQVVVSRGPIQRLLGLSDVRVQSAGGGGRGRRPEHRKESDDMHLGLFRHVTNAAEIRDLILERLRRFRETGLGDPDDASVATPEREAAPPDDIVAAMRELLAEAQALRDAVKS